ncbi:MAG: threonine/serine exporter family protein [Paraclostridium sp.]
MSTALTQIIMVVIGSVGIAIYFNVEKSKLPSIVLGGLISWITYVIFMNLTQNIFIATLISAIVVGIYSEIKARILRCPANMFLIPSIVPLLPGGSFYHMMYGVINTDFQGFKEKGFETMMIVLGISIGVVVGFFIFMIIFSKLMNFINIYKNRKINEKECQN